MKKTMIPFFFAAGLLIVGCGGEAETGKPAETTTTEETPPAAPQPVTTTSGNSFELVHAAALNDYTIKYTVLDYTTNQPVADLPIDEFSGPGEGEQLLKVRIEVEVLSLRQLNCKDALDAFSIVLTDGAEGIKAFQRFSEEFKAGMEPACLAIGEKEDLDFYFIVPADADLSNASLSLYRGSDYEPSVVKLNP